MEPEDWEIVVQLVLIAVVVSVAILEQMTG